MSEKKSFWGQVKSALVEEVPDKNGVPVAPTSVPVRNTLAPVVVPQAPFDVHPSLMPMRHNVDQAARQRLEQSILAAAPPGYTDVNDTIAALSDTVPDEPSRYRAALKLAAKRGHSVDNILGDVDKCIGVIEARGREFQDEIKKQVQQKVGARQKSVEQYDATIRSKQEQIQQLQSEIAQLSEQRGTEAGAITTETARIQAVSDGFEGAYEAVLEQLQDRRKKIEIYGKGGVL